MGNLLYKAKGLQHMHIAIMSVCNILLLIIGVAAIFFSQMKHTAQSISFSTSSGYSLGSGSFGGGYILKEEARNTILVIGIILIVLSLCFIESLFFSNKSYISVFDNHVEGVQSAAFFIRIKKPVNVTYDKIADIQLIKAANSLSTDKIVLYTKNIGNFIITAKGSEKAYEIIKSKI